MKQRTRQIQTQRQSSGQSLRQSGMGELGCTAVMHLIQILLPLADNEGKPLGPEPFAEVKSELTKRFKGLTAYSRAPAEGLWKPRQNTKRDEIVVYEVMVSSLNTRWWKQ